MKTLLLKLKKLALSPLRLLDYLVTEAKVVKAVCVTCSIFFVVLFFVDLSNTNKRINLLKSQVALQLLIKERDHVIEEQNQQMEEMITAIKEQGLYLNEAVKILNSQNQFILKLVDRLKELRAWPLEEVDPDPTTRAKLKLNEITLKEDGS